MWATVAYQRGLIFYMIISSHLFIMLGEVLVRLHNVQNANSKIRIVFILQNMSLYCKSTVLLITGSKCQGLILMYCCQFCESLKKKSTSEEQLILAEFHTELSSSWASALKFLRLCRWGAPSSEGNTGSWALCACNQTGLGVTSEICHGALKHYSAELTWTIQGGRELLP